MKKMLLIVVIVVALLMVHASFETKELRNGSLEPAVVVPGESGSLEAKRPESTPADSRTLFGCDDGKQFRFQTVVVIDRMVAEVTLGEDALMYIPQSKIYPQEYISEDGTTELYIEGNSASMRLGSEMYQNCEAAII